jgi:hypothetical protein
VLLSLRPCALLHAQVVPFFFYRGLERLTYSWSDRAFQALFTAVYAGNDDGRVLLFKWYATSNASWDLPDFCRVVDCNDGGVLRSVRAVQRPFDV